MKREASPNQPAPVQRERQWVTPLPHLLRWMGLAFGACALASAEA